MLKFFLRSQIERDDEGMESKENKYEYTEQDRYESHYETSPVFFERNL